MAAPVSAWGIDIGQAGLKAMKLRVSDDGQRVVAAAFDYIPHPKILSQPDANPEELIREAMKTFLGRNKIDGDIIAISVPGQSSLAKFIKLPPVESSKVAEIVKYEARQQIPFDLNDVIWDYQPIGGGVEESGFMLEAEVGLFAMKRELVYDALKPFTNNSKEVEIVQIAPLALYNYLSFDVLGFRKTAETPEPPAAEDYYVILDMGADNTTLLVSNGRSIWIRNVPIGGNHFTRALTREMKLTFAKAEHLKCNATKAPDPKAVFQAMRPVFNDYVSEIQRSIGYFGSVNRSAKIRKIIGVGNGFRLAGLQKFLQLVARTARAGNQFACAVWALAFEDRLGACAAESALERPAVADCITIKRQIRAAGSAWRHPFPTAGQPRGEPGRDRRWSRNARCRNRACPKASRHSPGDGTARAPRQWTDRLPRRQVPPPS